MPLDNLYQADRMTLIHYASRLEWMLEETGRILTIDERGNPHFCDGQRILKELEDLRSGLAADVHMLTGS